MTSHRLVSAGCLLTLALTGCVSDVPRKDFALPGAASTSVDQLSGNYCYYGPDFNIRYFRRGAEMIPFLDVAALAEPTSVSVDATSEQILFTYVDRDGVEIQEAFVPARLDAIWNDSALVISWRPAGDGIPSVGENVASFLFGIPAGVFFGWFADFGYSGSQRESRLFKLVDGRLVMTDSLRTEGYSQPRKEGGTFWAKEDSVMLLLDPATGECSASAEGRPLQPLFEEKGLDLRVPECAAQLEEQVASIMVEKGEAPEVAAMAARECLAALVEDRERWANFTVPSPSLRYYRFQVVKSKSRCVLRLYSAGKTDGSGKRVSELGGIFTYKSRPLPVCACNV